MQRNVHNAKGELTAYGFACGYQYTRSKGDNHKTIYKESGTYFVVSTINRIITTDTRETLGEAMKLFINTKL